VYGAEKRQIPADEDEALHARRLVAQKCLYGVDRNPMAVDLARLSLWLATLARDHEFTFLDHALKAGDSLVGLTRREIAAAHWDPSKPNLPLFRQTIETAVSRAIEGREAIRNAGDDVLIEAQAARHARVVDASEPARAVGDAVIAAHFSADKPRERELERQKVESWITSEPPIWESVSAKGDAFRTKMGWRPFHWEVEFPEVFTRDGPGFDAIVGNPPFAGKITISLSSGPRYLPWLQTLYEHAHGNADLVAHFFRRAFALLRDGGAFGLIATNTIGQGDTRATGLAPILQQGGQIYRAVKRYQWPNEGAAVIVSIVHLKKSRVPIPAVLDNQPVSRISAYLAVGALDDTPSRLSANLGVAFNGTKIYGQGFLFADDDLSTTPLAEMTLLLREHPSYEQFIKPYVGGEDVNTSSQFEPHRFAINITSLTLAQAEQTVPHLLNIVREKVHPERLKTKDTADGRILKRDWWRFFRPKAELYEAVRRSGGAILIPETSPHLVVAPFSREAIFSHALKVLALSGFAPFAVLQSRVHEIWARFFSSSMKDDLRYAPSDCFETFPFPPGYGTDEVLEAVGQNYHSHRAALMIAADEGMTKTYNRFHKSDEKSEAIQRLRELHDEMDRAVLCAYGWDDLAADLRPEFLTEETEDDHTYQDRYFWPAEARDRVLARLLALNAERHAEEVAEGRAPTARTDAGNGEDNEAEPQLSLD
jgi:hypothetical protein